MEVLIRDRSPRTEVLIRERSPGNLKGFLVRKEEVGLLLEFL
jgi:hypothetical protein